METLRHPVILKDHTDRKEGLVLTKSRELEDMKGIQITGTEDMKTGGALLSIQLDLTFKWIRYPAATVQVMVTGVRNTTPRPMRPPHITEQGMRMRVLAEGSSLDIL
jgi:hypothetical protein